MKKFVIQKNSRNILKEKMKYKYIPDRVFIDSEVLYHPITVRITNNLRKTPYEIVKNVKSFIKEFNFNYKNGKKYLLITKQKGKFIKPCPGTPHYLCCNYYIINLTLNCPLDCTYCILQYYLNNPFMIIYANIEDLFRELDSFLSPNKFYRIGTGELTDSLVFDHFTEFSKDLISYFANKNNTVFELKTKTTNIENLTKINPNGKTVVAWSLNSDRIAKNEEINAPSNIERIKTAKKIISYGYKVGFHFDPIIFYPDWEKDYFKIVYNIFENINAEYIAWISLGTLRFPPRLKDIIQNRFPKTKIVYDEFIIGLDGKFRYFKTLRLKIYKKFANWIRELSNGKVFIYLCMESKEIWEKILGWNPKGKRELGDKLCKIMLAK
ncbi:hypothetical protein NLD30_03510 [SCandidatus Aminicenantes bacterium Aminicenantia_JdfR_composite]|nr:hypothetical protein [SCandidatus Aminicenantes bacterium Aminicenantia_JdfR_composite]MCP2605519.1 hypothetical protein [Candidatus Aminicenantes bacterium AC-335-O07]